MTGRRMRSDRQDGDVITRPRVVHEAVWPQLLLPQRLVRWACLSLGQGMLPPLR